jgi:hypothetical protein
VSLTLLLTLFLKWVAKASDTSLLGCGCHQVYKKLRKGATFTSFLMLIACRNELELPGIIP